MSECCDDCILLAQARPPRPDPVPIPEEEDHVQPLPGPACEPLVLGKKEVAARVFPLLPQGLRDQYIEMGKQRGRAPVDLLAWDLGATNAKGGLNSPDQRVSVWSPDAHRTISQTDWEHITRSEAYRFIAGYREFRGGQFGVPHTPLSAALAAFIPPGHSRPIVESIFFANAPLAGAARRATRRSYEPATITGISDGDTVKVRVFRSGCSTEEGSIRFAGIDTPEKFRSEAKFWPQHEAVMNLWRDQGLIRADEATRDGPVGTLLANRMEYAGALSSFIMKDFLSFAIHRGGKFYLEETYNRVLMPGDDPAACDAVTLYDVYLRSIWVLRVAPPSLINQYIEQRLFEIMNSDRAMMRLSFDGSLLDASEPANGVQVWQHHQLAWLKAHGSEKERAKAAAAEAQLARWRQEGRTKLLELLDPQFLPPPSAMYSRQNVQWISAAYRTFLARHPDRAGDLNLAMVAMGAAYTYTKYRNDLTPAYLEMGGVVRAAGVGEWKDELVVLMDPNVRILNKETKRYEPYVMPRDCTGR